MALKGLNSNGLKLIAVIAMALDHCAALLLAQDGLLYLVMRFFGRLTAPVMCFFIAEGYYRTSNLKKYMGRLFLVAVISHVPYSLCFGDNIWAFWESTDVLFSLFFGLAALAIWESPRTRPWQKYSGLILCCLLAYPADWGYIAVLWILGFGIFHEDRKNQLVFYCAIAALYLLQPIVYQAAVSPMRLGVFLAVPFLLCYNGERGKKSKAIQWGFYLFYPAHLLVLFFISGMI